MRVVKDLNILNLSNLIEKNLSANLLCRCKLGGRVRSIPLAVFAHTNKMNYFNEADPLVRRLSSAVTKYCRTMRHPGTSFWVSFYRKCLNEKLQLKYLFAIFSAVRVARA